MWSLLLGRCEGPVWMPAWAACSGEPALAEVLDPMTFRGPFQPLHFCDFVTINICFSKDHGVGLCAWGTCNPITLNAFQKCCSRPNYRLLNTICFNLLASTTINLINMYNIIYLWYYEDISRGLKHHLDEINSRHKMRYSSRPVRGISTTPQPESFTNDR